MEKIDTINIGIVGHIDHGKTTLLQKLSGKWASMHSEELKRGITIKLGYADAIIYDDNGRYNIEKKGKAVRHVSFIDAPGHEMLMATMLSGAALIDGAILVVAANEGIKPQTREHLMALKAKKVKNLIIVQNKIDLVDSKTAEKNYNDIKDFLKSYWRDGEEVIIPVSAQQGVNVGEVWRAIVELKIPNRDLKSNPVFVVARSFDINKPGTKPGQLKGAVLGGSLKYGILKEGDEIEIKPGRKVGEKYESLKTRILGLYRGSEKVKELTPGGSMSIETELDMSLAREDLLAQNVVSHIGKLPELSSNIKLNFELFKEVFGISRHEKVAEVKAGETLMLSINTSITGGAVKRVKAGEMEIELRLPVVAFKGENVGIARNVGGHWRLIGYGEIL